MPFSLLPTALGVSFALVWMFIGAMILRDNQMAARRDRDADSQILPLPPRKPALPPTRPRAAFLKRRRGRVARNLRMRAVS